MPPATPAETYDTPNIKASDAAWVVHSSTRIAAPASLVFRTLRNTDTWKDWNPWVPRVVVTYQTPDEDTATADEITELVRNTSIAGSFDSDLTDGIVGGGSRRRRSSEYENPPNTPPLKLRSKSNASHFSAPRSNSQASDSPLAAVAASEASQPTSAATNGHTPASAAAAAAAAAASSSPSSAGHLSAAQKYAASQEARRASVASGEKLPPVSSNNLATDPFLSPTSTTYHESRRKSTSANVDKARARANTAMLLSLYGEPSVRIQLNTKMTFLVRMNPRNKSDYKQLHVVVTHVSRPDDPSTDGTNITPLTRSRTHTLSDSPSDHPVYRIVWAIDPSKSSLSTIKNSSAFPKSLLHAERVHEIRPIITGSGAEECEYRQWECQKGPLAKLAKKKYADYIPVMFERWGTGLGQFCEGMGGKVDRRDFSVDLAGVTEEIV